MKTTIQLWMKHCIKNKFIPNLPMLSIYLMAHNYVTFLIFKRHLPRMKENNKKKIILIKPKKKKNHFLNMLA